MYSHLVLWVCVIARFLLLIITSLYLSLLPSNPKCHPHALVFSVLSFRQVVRFSGGEGVRGLSLPRVEIE